MPPSVRGAAGGSSVSSEVTSPIGARGEHPRFDIAEPGARSAHHPAVDLISIHGDTTAVDCLELAEFAAYGVMRIGAQLSLHMDQKPVGKITFEKEGVMAIFIFIDFGSEHGKARHETELAAGFFQHLRDEGLGELFPAKIRNPAFPPEETERGRRANKAVDLHQIAQAIPPQSTRGSDDHRVDFAFPQSVGEVHLSVSVRKFEEVRGDRHWMTSGERNRDASFGREQSLGLDGNVWQPLLQFPERQRGLTIAPATHNLKMRPERGYFRGASRIEQARALG